MPVITYRDALNQALREEMRRQGPISPAVAVEILEPIASVLDAAHAVGVVHRDLKPENVMVSHDAGGKRLLKVLDLVLAVHEQRFRRVETHDVNEAIEELMRRQPPPHSRGRVVKIRYGTQVSVGPPTFLLFSNLPQEVPEHYIRYVHNSFRERWGFLGVPIRIRLKASTKESART